MLDNPLLVKLYVDRNAHLHWGKSNKIEVKIKNQGRILMHFKCFLMRRADLFDKKQGIYRHPWEFRR